MAKNLLPFIVLREFTSVPLYCVANTSPIFYINASASKKERREIKKNRGRWTFSKSYAQTLYLTFSAVLWIGISGIKFWKWHKYLTSGLLWKFYFKTTYVPTYACSFYKYFVTRFETSIIILFSNIRKLSPISNFDKVSYLPTKTQYQFWKFILLVIIGFYIKKNKIGNTVPTIGCLHWNRFVSEVRFTQASWL
jgi:hypothetical protein